MQNGEFDGFTLKLIDIVSLPGYNQQRDGVDLMSLLAGNGILFLYINH